MAKRTVNKSEFVRSLGSIPAADVVKKAAEKGIKLSMAHVYTIRSAANRKAANGSAGRVARRGRPPKNGASTGLRSKMDRLVKSFVEEVIVAIRGASLDEIARR